MATVLTLRLPPGSERFRPDPFPGSLEAMEQGCTCPASQPWPGELFIAVECPVHEPKRVAS